MRQTEVNYDDHIILKMSEAIQQSEDDRYILRLRAILLVAHGISCNHVADLLGNSPRAVAYWIQRYKKGGFEGLYESYRSGRPRKLNDKNVEKIRMVLRESPAHYGFREQKWSGKLLSSYIQNQFMIELSVRQCQRIIRKFGFNREKPKI